VAVALTHTSQEGGECPNSIALESINRTTKNKIIECNLCALKKPKGEHVGIIKGLVARAFLVLCTLVIP